MEWQLGALLTPTFPSQRELKVTIVILRPSSTLYVASELRENKQHRQQWEDNEE